MTHTRSGIFLTLGLLLALLGGCATAKTATKKDFSVFETGVSRAVVIDELGEPRTTTRNREGNTVDVFTFVQGDAPSKKTPRPVEAEQAEATELMALMEQSGRSPMRLLTGKKLTVQVNYDAELRVLNTVLLRME